MASARAGNLKRPAQAGLQPELPRRAWAALVLGAVLAGTVVSGCTVCRHAKRTLLDEPAEFSARRDRRRSIDLYREWAEYEWQQCAGRCGDGVDGGEFGAGFRDGFVDYVYAGGDGAPPPLPPRKFWNVAHRNPAGHAASHDWFAGYRQGAAAARDGGYRQQAIVQSSFEFSSALPYDYHGAPGSPLSAPYGMPGEDVPALPAAPLPAAPTLPAPRVDPAPKSTPRGPDLPEPDGVEEFPGESLEVHVIPPVFESQGDWPVASPGRSSSARLRPAAPTSTLEFLR